MIKYIFVICKIHKSINIHKNKNGYKTLEQTLHKEDMHILGEDTPTIRVTHQGNTSSGFI